MEECFGLEVILWYMVEFKVFGLDTKAAVSTGSTRGDASLSETPDP